MNLKIFRLFVIFSKHFKEIKMKKAIIFILFFISANLFSQNEKYFTCEEINNTIIDRDIYEELSNGKLIVKIESKSNKIYKIIIESDKSFYYLTKPIMKKIKRSIKKNKCQNINISKIDNIKDISIKIIRD